MARAFRRMQRVATAALQPDWTEWFDLDRLIAESLIGTAKEPAGKCACLAEEQIVRATAVAAFGSFP